MSRCHGLSRGELVVVLLMVACAGTLGLSLIVKARESAARTSCQNNLRQLALGVMSFHDCDGALPPLVEPDGGLRSVFALLGPYLEASCRHYTPGRSAPEAYHAPSSVAFHFIGKDVPGVQYGGDANQAWRLFCDPADATPKGQRDIPQTLPSGTVGYYTTGNYAANGLLPWGQKSDGTLFGERPALAVMFAERPQVCLTEAGETVHNLWGVGFYSPTMPAFATLTAPSPPGLWSTGQIAPVGDGQFRVGRADADTQLADVPTPIQFVRAGLPCDPRLPGTPHRSGMPVAMSDGSVRVFACDTDPWVFWTACLPVP